MNRNELLVLTAAAIFKQSDIHYDSYQIQEAIRIAEMLIEEVEKKTGKPV